MADRRRQVRGGRGDEAAETYRTYWGSSRGRGERLESERERLSGLLAVAAVGIASQIVSKGVTVLYGAALCVVGLFGVVAVLAYTWRAQYHARCADEISEALAAHTGARPYRHLVAGARRDTLVDRIRLWWLSCGAFAVSAVAGVVCMVLAVCR